MIHFKLFALIIMNIKLCDINVSTITMARIYIIRLIHKAIVSKEFKAGYIPLPINSADRRAVLLSN
jgi:hypothetical protein